MVDRKVFGNLPKLVKLFLLLTIICLLNVHAHPAINRINFDKLRHLNDAPLSYIKDQLKVGKIEHKTSDDYALSSKCCVEYEGKTKPQESKFQGSKKCKNSNGADNKNKKIPNILVTQNKNNLSLRCR